MPATIEPVSVPLPVRLDDFYGRQRQLAAEGVEYAQHSISLEVRHAIAPRSDTDFLDAQDDVHEIGVGRLVPSIARARCREGFHARRCPPLGRARCGP